MKEKIAYSLKSRINKIKSDVSNIELNTVIDVMDEWLCDYIYDKIENKFDNIICNMSDIKNDLNKSCFTILLIPPELIKLVKQKSINKYGYVDDITNRLVELLSDEESCKSLIVEYFQLKHDIHVTYTEVIHNNTLSISKIFNKTKKPTNEVSFCKVTFMFKQFLEEK